MVGDTDSERELLLSVRMRPENAGLSGYAVLPSYVGNNIWRRNRARLAWIFLAICAVYGFLFSIFADYYLLQLTTPLIIMAMVVIWLLPEMGWAPVRLLERLMFAFILGLLCWPDYLALAFSGLPWITMVRLIITPILFTFAICLSISKNFRKDLLNSINATPIVWKLLIAFTAIAFISIGYSTNIDNSVNKFSVAILYWVMLYFVGAFVFMRAGRPTLLVFMLWGIVLVAAYVAMWEWRLQALPWAGHIPNFLKIEDPTVLKILSARARAATGIYRVQGKFTTPLGLAEYMALATPFVLHIIMTTRWMAVRIAAIATLPLIFRTIVLTDSRLGMVGFFLSFLFYMLVWGLLRWRKDRNSLFGPALVLAYPLIFSGFIVATFVVGRLRHMIWGSGAQQFSTDSRQAQIDAGIPMILKHPWGYGLGQGAATLGFRNPAGELTIDTYFLAIGLETGILGFIVYYGMFIAAMIYGGRALLTARSREVMILAPLCIAMANFFVIKSIFSQLENHPLIFLMLGAISALVLRAQQEAAADQPLPKAQEYPPEVR